MFVFVFSVSSHKCHARDSFALSPSPNTLARRKEDHVCIHHKKWLGARDQLRSMLDCSSRCKFIWCELSHAGTSACRESRWETTIKQKKSSALRLRPFSLTWLGQLRTHGIDQARDYPIPAGRVAFQAAVVIRGCGIFCSHKRTRSVSRHPPAWVSLAVISQDI